MANTHHRRSTFFAAGAVILFVAWLLNPASAVAEASSNHDIQGLAIALDEHEAQDVATALTEHDTAAQRAELATKCVASEASPLVFPTSVVGFCPADGKICFDGDLCRAQCRLCGIELGACVWGLCRCFDT